MKSAIPLAAAFLLLGLNADPLAAQPCPTNSFWTGGQGFYEEYPTAATWSYDALTGYDLVAGALRASVSGGGEAGSGLGLYVHDRYRIVGPVSGDPISVLVRLRVTGLAEGAMMELPFRGLVCQRTSATLRLSSGTGFDEVEVRSQQQPTCTNQAIDEILEIKLEHLPGEEFEVTASFLLSGAHGVRVTTRGSLSFEGLPPGYTIQSCQGYAGPVVPVVLRSWGGLKSAYR